MSIEISAISYSMPNYNLMFRSKYSPIQNNVSYLAKLEKMNSSEAFSYLNGITSNTVESKKFIEEVTKNPRESLINIKKIFNALGSKENFDKWYFGKTGYMQAFHNYIEEFYEKSNSIDELVRFMPNWGDWKIAEKSRKLTGNEHYTVGELPNELGDRTTFEQLGNFVKHNYWNSSRQEGEININGKSFNLKYPQNGSSGKVVAIINDKYILKTSYNKKYKADSPYLNMMVDYYLKLNNCSNVAKFKYYDEASETVLYEKSKIIPLKYTTLGKDYFYSPKTIFDNFNDAKSLGIVFTDRGTSNYIKSGNDNVVIDSGHAEYMDILKPGLTGMHITLPANTGFSQLAYEGMLRQ